MPEGETIPMAKKLEFRVTNNMAEYEACIYGIEAALATGAKDLLVYGDSLLVINQANEEWEVKKERLKPYNSYLKTLMRGFNKCLFMHLSRDENQMADALATLSSMWDKPTRTTMKPFGNHEDKSSMLWWGISYEYSDRARGKAVVL